MIRRAGGGFSHPKRGSLSAVVPVLGIRHFVGSVEAESHGRPFGSTPNTQKPAQRDAADGVFAPTRYF